MEANELCRVVSPATLRVERSLTSQWICEFPKGTLLKILELDTTQIGRQRARVRAQLPYLSGWISLRTASLDVLVEKLEDAGHFEAPEAGLLCGQSLQLEDKESLCAALARVAEHLRLQPEYQQLPRPSLLKLFLGAPEEELVMRGGIWASVSFRKDPSEGLSILSLLLIAQHAAVLDFARTFGRLYEEILCLEDSDAEALFDVQGETRKARRDAQELSSQCATVAGQLLLPEPSWRLRWPDPVALVDALERGKRKLEAFHIAAQRIQAQRRIFVARLKAAVEARAATEAVSAAALLRDVLAGGRHLDFPMVTEICERATSDAAELAQVADALEALLASPDLSTRLKVLTITNELLYDGLARQTFASRPRFLAPELDVEASEMAMELGKANAKMLANEIARRLSSEVVVAQAGCLMPRAPVATTSWLHGLTRTPQRQDAQLELSWPQSRRALEVLQVQQASQDEVSQVLDECYRSFESTASSIEKLLLQPVDQDFRELVESFLHSAALVQRGALDWKLEVVNCEQLPRPRLQQLQRFLHRAVSVGDSLNACLAVLLARASPSSP